MFCTKCGVQVDENADFCHKCGTKINKTEQQPSKPNISASKITPETDKSILPEIPHATRVSCPNCNSQDLVAVSDTETEVSGGGYGAGKGCCGWILFGPFGLLCGLCGTSVKSKSKTRLFWVCKSCGHKFRSAEDLKEEENEEGMAMCLNALAVFAIVYIAGNLFADKGIRFLGIPSWIYITVGVLGGIITSLCLLGYYIGKMSGAGVQAKKFSLVAVSASILAFIAGIIFAVTDSRFFWIPAWIYIVLIRVLHISILRVRKFHLDSGDYP